MHACYGIGGIPTLALNYILRISHLPNKNLVWHKEKAQISEVPRNN